MGLTLSNVRWLTAIGQRVWNIWYTPDGNSIERVANNDIVWTETPMTGM